MKDTLEKVEKLPDTLDNISQGTELNIVTDTIDDVFEVTQSLSDLIEIIKFDNEETLVTAKVTKQIDGDTTYIEVKGDLPPQLNGQREHKLRILNIDTPEDTKTKQYQGDVATQRAKELLEEKRLLLSYL